MGDCARQDCVKSPSPALDSLKTLKTEHEGPARELLTNKAHLQCVPSLTPEVSAQAPKPRGLLFRLVSRNLWAETGGWAPGTLPAVRNRKR